MLTIYFDRNVFADICELRNGLTEEDVRKIEDAVRSGSVNIPISGTLLEETLQTLESSEDAYKKHLKVVLNLINTQFMVKEPNQLLKDDCFSYAFGKAYQRFMATPKDFYDLLDPSKNKQGLDNALNEVKKFFEVSSTNITTGLLKARNAGQEQDVGRPSDFSELWNGLSESIAKNFLERCPTEVRRRCYARGIKKMLDIKSIRLYTVYYISLIHSGWFGLQKNPRAMKPGDVGDFFHAVQSSAADFFVTQESKDRPSKLPYILNQVATQGFKVVSLRDFLQSL